MRGTPRMLPVTSKRTATAWLSGWASLRGGMAGLVLPAEGLRPKTDLPLEGHAQIFGVLETGQAGDGLDRQVALHQQLLDPVELHPDDLGVRRAADVPGEAALQHP